MDEYGQKLMSITEWAREISEGMINLKDLTVVLMENSLIEQAIENHKLM